MALTPEDVVNKRFQPTKFREGYDQDEVDDFLDEVVVELRRLNQENEELRQRLIAGEARINELQRSGASQAAAPSFGEQPQYGVAPVAAAAPAPMAYPAPVDPNGVDPSNTNNLLQLARKLHEEHVREGVEKRDALIAEGHATAARVVSEAENAQRQQLSALAQERKSLEDRIEDLRTFEREYRQKLKSYIEGQLSELESPNAMTNSKQASQPVPVQSAPVPAQSAQPVQAQSAPVAAQSQPVQAAPAYEPIPSQQQQSGYQGFGGN